MWEVFVFFYKQDNKVVLCVARKSPLRAQLQEKVPSIVNYVYILIGSWCIGFIFPPRNWLWLPLRTSTGGVWAIWLVLVLHRAHDHKCTHSLWRLINCWRRFSHFDMENTEDKDVRSFSSFIIALYPSWYLGFPLLQYYQRNRDMSCPLISVTLLPWCPVI